MLSHLQYTKAKLVMATNWNWLQLAAHNHIADYLIVPSAS
jgi:hypothetical protein